MNILFLMDSTLNSRGYGGTRYLEQTEKFLQPAPIKAAWLCESDEQLLNRTGTIDLVIADSKTLEYRRTALVQFCEEGSVSVAIEYACPEQLPSEPPFPGARVFAKPENSDQWLEQMYELIET